MRVLEARLIEAVRRHRAADPRRPLFLVVPSRLLGVHLRRRAAGTLGGVANLHVLTLPDLARDLAAASLARSGRRPLPPAGERLLVEQGIRAAIPDRDGYFSGVRGRRNFPGALLRTLLDLKRAAVGPGAVAAAAPGDPAAGREGAKLRELAACYRAVEDGLAAHGFHDASDLLAEATRVVTEAPACLGPAAVCVYGFLELNVLERRLLDACGRAVPLEWFGPEPEAEPLPAPGAIEIVGAPGEEREVREIARVVLGHVEAGGRFDDVGILLRQPGAYRAAIRDVFTAAGIPYAVGPAGGLVPSRLETREGLSLALLVEAHRSDFSRAAVLEFLTFADLRPGSGVSPAEWDRLTREAGIVGGARAWRERLDRLGARLGPAERSEAEEEDVFAARARDREAVTALRRVMRRLLGGLGRLPAEGPLADLVQRVGRSLRGLLRPGPAVDALAGALAGLAELAPLQARVTRDELWTLVEALLAGPADAEAEPAGGGVFVGDLVAAGGLDFPVTIVPGLVEGGFPVPARQDPILLDRERRGLGALPLGDAERELDRVRFRLIAGSGAHRLVLTYPRLDVATGRPRVPSFFLLDLLEWVTGRRHDFQGLLAFPGHRAVSLRPAPPAARAFPVDEREWLIGRALDARAEPGALLAGLPGAARGFAAIQARERAPVLTAHDGLLPGGVEPAEEPLAATWLEAYAACPFRYFLGRVLGVAPVEEPERVRTLGPADRGRLVHAVLEATFRRLGEAGLLPLDRSRLVDAHAVLDGALAELCAEAERRGVTGLPALWEGERARLRAELRATLQAEAAAGESDWVPALFEVGFGLPWLPGAGPALAYTLPDGTTLQLRGKIDRIDLAPDGSRARVLDYKTGRLRGLVGADRLQKGRALQLPIYRLAAEAILSARGLQARVEDARYWYLFGRDAGRRVAFTRAGWEARRADFDRALALMVEGIRAGRFFAWPMACAPRTPCRYDLACGAERRRWAEAKAADPAAARHAELDAIP